MRFSPKWREAANRALSMCESSGIDPEMFFESIAEGMGWFCHTQGTPFYPSMLSSKGAVTRYNKWLGRRHAEGMNPRQGFIKSTDDRLRAELAYIEVYAVMYEMSPKDRLRAARDAARSVVSGYVKCSRRRLIALCEFLHRLHPDLPDVLCLSRGWRLFDVMGTAYALLEP